MYRIELVPGEVTVFRTIEELATGVRNGLITAKARIYHSASDKWLPIEFHPHYKQALELKARQATDAAGQKRGAAPKQASSKGGASKPRNEGFTFLNVPLSPVTPLPKAKPRVADLPYIEADRPAAEAPAHEPVGPSSPREEATATEPAAPTTPAAESPTVQSPSDHSPAGDSAVGPLLVEYSPTFDAPADSTPAGAAPTQDVPVAPHSPVDHSQVDRWPADGASDAPIVRSPAYDVADHHQSGDPSPAHEVSAHHSPLEHSPDREAPVHGSPVEHEPADEDVLARSLRFEPMPAAAEAHVIGEPLREAPRGRLAVEELFAPPAPRTPALPLVSESPVLELPTITYPEITPVEPPVAVRTASGSRSKRTLHLAGAVILLAAGGYASTTVFSFGRSDGFTAASAIADRPVVPAPAPAAPPAAGTASEPGGAQPAGTLTSRTAPGAAGTLSGSSTPSPVSQAPLPPASSGFAPALESRAIVPTAPSSASRPDTATDSSAVIAPAIDMQVAAPELQGADSLVSATPQKGDSAMKRILRAVSGRKDQP